MQHHGSHPRVDHLAVFLFHSFGRNREKTKRLSCERSTFIWSSHNRPPKSCSGIQLTTYVQSLRRKPSPRSAPIVHGDTEVIFLDLLLSIDRDGQLRTSLYDKRDDFNLHITNFPFLSSNIPSSPAYDVFISQLIRYARACSSYECFILRAAQLSNKLLGQICQKRLKSFLRKSYGLYGDLTNNMRPLSWMLHDILEDDHIQWHPPLIRYFTYLWHFTDLDLITEFDFLPNCVRLPYNICNGCGMPREDAHSSWHLVLSHFGTCMCSNVETNYS